MWFIILTVLGLLIAPIFTLGCVLIHFDYTVIGIFAIIVSFLRGSQVAYLKSVIMQLQEEIKVLKEQKKSN